MTSLFVRHALFAGICAVTLVLFLSPVVALASLALRDDRYIATLAIPLISVALVWLNQGEIFRGAQYRLATAIIFALAGLTLFAISVMLASLVAAYLLSIKIFALVLIVTGAFVGCYGAQAGRTAIFPLVFLVLMIPIPATILDHAVVALQHGSAEVSYRIFKLTGAPVFRDSPVRFSLPGVTIEIANECSGIRSSISLFVTSLVAGYLLLRSNWNRTFLALMTLPIAIIKNALRIVTISYLGVYVDPGFLNGRLHRYSGLPFSLIALIMLAPLLLLLIRTERNRQQNSVEPSDPVSATAV
jgi:exosortase